MSQMKKKKKQQLMSQMQHIAHMVERISQDPTGKKNTDKNI